MVYANTHARTHTRTHTHIHLTALCPGLSGWASTRKVKPIWILLEQETVSGNGIRWAICKSAPRTRQTSTPAPHHSVFCRPDALPAAQPTVSKHWRQWSMPTHKTQTTKYKLNKHTLTHKKINNTKIPRTAHIWVRVIMHNCHTQQSTGSYSYLIS